jgi:hypothetical protein
MLTLLISFPADDIPLVILSILPHRGKRLGTHRKTLLIIPGILVKFFPFNMGCGAFQFLLTRLAGSREIILNAPHC